MAKKQGRTAVDYEREYAGLSINDTSDPNSLVNFAPSIIADKIKSIPSEMFEMSEEDLLRTNAIDDKLERLRVTFWQEYGRAIRTDDQMRAPNIFMGICTMTEFKRICEQTHKVLYIIMPLASFYTQMEYLLTIGFRRALDVLKMNPIKEIRTKEGDLVSQVDIKLANLQKDYFKYAVEVARPEEPKKIELEAKHLHAHKTLDQVEAPLDMALIDAKLAQIEAPVPQPTFMAIPSQEAVYEQIKAKDDQ